MAADKVEQPSTRVAHRPNLHDPFMRAHCRYAAPFRRQTGTPL